LKGESHHSSKSKANVRLQDASLSCALFSQGMGIPCALF
jgi:hypothetical protein